MISGAARIFGGSATVGPSCNWSLRTRMPRRKFWGTSCTGRGFIARPASFNILVMYWSACGGFASSRAGRLLLHPGHSRKKSPDRSKLIRGLFLPIGWAYMSLSVPSSSPLFPLALPPPLPPKWPSGVVPSVVVRRLSLA